MKSNFKQQFQDSEANFSELENNNNQYQNQNDQQGYPIQLARFKDTTKMIQLDQKALDIIAECDLPVGFVTFVGRYRVGKSCLLNRILQLSGNGFKVSNTTRQCTKGIWMWSKPFYSPEHQCYLFFLDTQGTQALEKQTQTDIKLFTLNCLLSTYLVFNSIGNIDERSIEQLNLVTSLSKNILISGNISNKQNENLLHLYMPKFMWLLRDFALELRDDRGRPINPTEYLQQCLSSSGTLVSSYNTDQKKIKNEIVKVFKDRECFTLVRPARQQSQLQKLNELPDHALRKNFIEGVNQLKETIFKKAMPKTWQGQPLYGGSIVSMLQNFVESMNNGGIPKIKSAWQQIAQDEGAFAYNRALQKYNEVYSLNFTQDKPFKNEQLHQILGQIRESSLMQFSKCVSQPNEMYHTKLKQYLKSKQRTILQVNKQLCEVRNIQILKDLSIPLMRKFQSGGYKAKKKNLTKDIDQLVKQYNNRAIGQSKGDIISQFLATLNPIIISLAEDDQIQRNDAKMTQNLAEQFQKRTKILEQQVNALKSQNQAKDNILKKKERQIRDANQQLKKKQNNGCCVIM